MMNKRTRLHPHASNVLEFRYHHIRQILGRFRLVGCFMNQDWSVDDIHSLVESPVEVVTLSLRYDLVDKQFGNGGIMKHSWLYGCKFPLEFAVECVFGACLYFEKRGVVPRDLAEVRKRVLNEKSEYLSISSEAIRWLESGLNRLY